MGIQINVSAVNQIQEKYNIIIMYTHKRNTVLKCNRFYDILTSKVSDN